MTKVSLARTSNPTMMRRFRTQNPLTELKYSNGPINKSHINTKTPFIRFSFKFERPK